VQDGQQQQRPISEQAVAGLAMPVRHGYKIDLVDLRAGQPLLQGRVASGLHGGRRGDVWAPCGQQERTASWCGQLFISALLVVLSAVAAGVAFGRPAPVRTAPWRPRANA
jgi:hypothetical protein